MFIQDPHCVKYVPIRSYSGPYFPALGLNTDAVNSVRMRENTDQNNSEYGHFLRSASLWFPSKIFFITITYVYYAALEIVFN